MDFLFTAFEIIGTIAFSISGAIKGIKHDLDIFGVAVLGLVTAVGGGVIRDLIIGYTPPKVFRSPLCAIISVVVSLLCFAFFYFVKPQDENGEHLMRTQMFFIADTIGLAAFTAIGIESAYSTGAKTVSVLVFVGVITGVGGGVLRDITLGTIPHIFRKQVYALATILGSAVHIIAMNLAGNTIAMILDFICVIVIRVLAATYRWNLPHIHSNDSRNKSVAGSKHK